MSRYLRLLRSNPSLVGAAFVVRLGCSALPLTVILLAQERSDSFQFAGGAGAALALGALCLPIQGRLLDLWGPSLVFPIAAGLSVPVLLFQGLGQPSLFLLLPLAFWTSATQPAVTSYMRSYWQKSFSEDLHLAGNALESALTRLLNILGPLLVSLIVLIGELEDVFVISALLIIAGSLLLARNKRLAPAEGHQGRLRPTSQLLLIWSAAATAGWTIGVSELLFPLLSLPDLARAGILFAAVGAGYLVGSLWSGATARQTGSYKTVLFFFAGSLLFFLFGALPLPLLPLLFLFGATGAVAANHLQTLLGREAPSRNLSEAYTWSLAATVIGIALGHVAAGPPADNATPEWLFGIAVLPGALWLVMAAWSWRSQN